MFLKTLWGRSKVLYSNPLVLRFLCLGFSSGLPFLLTLSTLSFWMSEQGISKTTIGLFMATTLPYSLKFLWAPLIEIKSIPFLSGLLGQKKAWGFLSQILLFGSIIALGFSNPPENLGWGAFWCFCVSFFAASQDIVIDALRVELVQDDLSGAAAATESIGFRLGMLVSGAGALYLAHMHTWEQAYLLTSFLTLIGMVSLLSINEEKADKSQSYNQSFLRYSTTSIRGLINHVPFAPLLLFIIFFKFSDIVLNSMGAPFLYELGFSKLEFAHISKFFGISLMAVGGLLAGLIIHSLSLSQCIILCAFLQSISCLMFIVQSLIGHHLGVLTITIGVESFASGMTSTAFIAYLSTLCRKDHSAFDFTLLYSLGSLARVVISALSGFISDHWGWESLFFVSALSIIPALYTFMLLSAKERTLSLS